MIERRKNRLISKVRVIGRTCQWGEKRFNVLVASFATARNNFVDDVASRQPVFIIDVILDDCLIQQHSIPDQAGLCDGRSRNTLT